MFNHPMVIVFWLRHGESYVNLNKEFSYKLVDKPLTPKGQNQAQQTALYFKRIDISKIYCSPLKRAVETAQIVANVLNLDIHILEEFREVNVGILERNLPTSEAWNYYFQVTEAWKLGNYRVRFEGGEDFLELRDRMWKGFSTIENANSDGKILVVGHGGNFMCVLADLCRNFSSNFISDKHIPNCAITTLDLTMTDTGLTSKLIKFADASHIHGDAASFAPGIPEKIKK